MSRSDVAPTEPPSLWAAIRAFEDAGAVSEATARPLAEMPGLEPTVAVGLAARGIVREAAPGRYYLFAGTAAARRRRLVTLAAVLFVLVLLPLIALQLTH